VKSRRQSSFLLARCMRRASRRWFQHAASVYRVGSLWFFDLIFVEVGSIRFSAEGNGYPWIQEPPALIVQNVTVPTNDVGLVDNLTTFVPSEHWAGVSDWHDGVDERRDTRL